MKLNNGVLRGSIYTTLAAASVVGPALTVWKDTPPANGYEIASVAVGTLGAMATALRAFLDQHISRTAASSNETQILHRAPIA